APLAWGRPTAFNCAPLLNGDEWGSHSTVTGASAGFESDADDEGNRDAADGRRAVGRADLAARVRVFLAPRRVLVRQLEPERESAAETQGDGLGAHAIRHAERERQRRQSLREAVRAVDRVRIRVDPRRRADGALEIHEVVVGQQYSDETTEGLPAFLL